MKIQRKIKRHIKRTLAAVVLAGLTVMTTTPAFALPQNGTVVPSDILGSITIPGANNNSLTISVGRNGIINWESFSIDPGEIVNFNFTDTFAVLNRVTGPEMSKLLGALNADGSVFLVNPNGILIGAGATINTSNLVLSTLDVSNEKFMQLTETWADNPTALTFSKGDQAIAGAIDIQGGTYTNINSMALLGGSITVAPNVTISGGEVTMIAADQAQVRLMQDGGSMEVYDTLAVNAQLGNVVDVKGAIDTDDIITLIGGKVKLNGASLTANDIDLMALKTMGDSNDAVTNTLTLTASADNSIEMTGTSIQAENVMVALGGKVSIQDSDISLGAGSMYGNSKVIVMAANEIESLKLDDADLPHKMTITADRSNSIVLDGLTISTPDDSADIWVLGGKVNIQNSDLIGDEIFIGAGSQVSIEADYDQGSNSYEDGYYFGSQLKSAVGNDVIFGGNTTITANGESGVYGNSITNHGSITSHAYYGFSLVAADEMSWNEQEDAGTYVFSKNNTVVNTGTIIADQANFEAGWDSSYNVFDITAGSIENTGHIAASKNTGGIAAEYFAAGAISGIDDNATTSIMAQQLDLTNNNYKITMDEGWSIQHVEAIALGGTDPIEPPVNPTVDEILNSGGTVAEKQQQLVEVIHDINALSVNEQTKAIEGAIGSIVTHGSLSQAERQIFTAVVVNNYEGTASIKHEADQQVTASRESGVPEIAAVTPALTDDGNSSNVEIE